MTSSNMTEARRIVVGVDGSIQSKQALRWAAHFAATSRAGLEAVAAVAEHATCPVLVVHGDKIPTEVSL